MYQTEDRRYCYPGTTVLKNRAGIREPIELEKLETFYFTLRASQGLPNGKLDERHYRRIHRYLFGEVYTWAGRYRQVRIAKGESMFCYPEHIADHMRRLFGELADRNCLRDIERSPFARGLAHFLAQLNAIHPFREGNGRTQNLFLGIIADRAGHPLDYERIDPKKLLDAMIRSFYGDEGLLCRVMFDALRG